jgi:acyl dehydratase
MRLLVDGFLDPESSMGARGLDELRWPRPVHPGDTLRVEVEILHKRKSESRPEMGHVRWKLRGYNQDDEVVCSFERTALSLKRDA